MLKAKARQLLSTEIRAYNSLIRVMSESEREDPLSITPTRRELIATIAGHERAVLDRLLALHREMAELGE